MNPGVTLDGRHQKGTGLQERHLLAFGPIPVYCDTFDYFSRLLRLFMRGVLME